MPETEYAPWGPKARRLIAEARRVNAERDVIDREAGFAAESDEPPPERLRTALCALNAGMEREDWAAVAEAAVMIAQTEAHLRQVVAVVVRGEH